MQDVQRFDVFGHIHHAKNTVFVSDANFARARADRVERLPVVGVESRLNLVKLKPCQTTRFIGKGEQITITGA